MNVLLFDGKCNLCQKSVQFILQHEKEPKIYFASLQSKIGQQMLSAYHLQQDLNSIVFIDKQGAHIKSTAALHVCKYLRSPWHLISYFTFIPRFIRNNIYDLVAKYRYQFQNKKTSCMLMKDEWKKRFLNESPYL